METILEHGEHLERELTPESLAAPATGAIVLHALLAGAIVYSAWIMGLFHHNLWGNPGAGGAMQVNLVSSALPLPAEKVNENVLTTETPSEAPAPPSPKEQKQVDETAIPIVGKNAKPQKQNTPKTQKNQPQPQQNVAQFGEQSGSIMPRTVQPQVGSNGPTAVGDNDFASRFGWYVDQINRSVSTNWNRYQVDPRTPKGARVYMIFSILKDGSHSEGQLDRSSGSPTLDRSCVQALQRIEAFQRLPNGYNPNKLQVSYYCEY